jgi:hypothetical protein
MSTPSNRAARVFNRKDVADMFKDGATWISRKRDNPKEIYLSRIDIELIPGVYTIQKGDTLQLIGFTNKYRIDQETGETNERKPHFILRLRLGSKNLKPDAT